MIQKTFELKPLSINRAFQGRRFKTNEYKHYERDLNALGGHFKTIRGDIEVIIEWYLKNDKMTDIDNPTKPVLDYLTKAGAYEDDRKIRALHLYKYKSNKDYDYFRITITKYED
jgi:Holliday junction resolvase RusA-like endonuclease